MENLARLDRVTIFNNKLSFLVPHEWVETVDADHYLYHCPQTDSGWLRVTLLTFTATKEQPSAADHLKHLFDGEDNVIVEPQTKNVVCISEKDSEEEGKRIHLYYWKVANAISTDLVREAVFSYTVLRDRIDEEQTRRTVKTLGQFVSQSEFMKSDAD